MASEGIAESTLGSKGRRRGTDFCGVNHGGRDLHTVNGLSDENFCFPAESESLPCLDFPDPFLGCPFFLSCAMIGNSFLAGREFP